MENPDTWGKAEKIIDQAITDYARDVLHGIVGLSLARRIADDLRAAGMVKAESMWACPGEACGHAEHVPGCDGT